MRRDHKHRLARRLLLLLLALFLAGVLSQNCLAGNTLTINAEEQLAFAEDTFAQGEYYRAISEYRRFLHFFPDHSNASLAAYRIGLAYFLGQEYAEAAKALDAVVANYPGSSHAGDAALLICQCHAKQAQYEDARNCLSQVALGAKTRELADRARYDAGWVYIREGEFMMASQAFSGMTQEGKQTYGISSLVSELDKGAQLQEKEPVVAGVLAIVPGLGHVYTNRYQDAAIAFLLNAGLALAAYESFDNDQEALGAVIGIVGFGFYAGNIYSASSSAHKYNRRQEAAFIKSLEPHKVYFNAGPLQGTSGAGASVTIPF